ncbi:MAG: IS200/IS605 family transposase [Nitrospirae bacterium]|nr:IS200/IS605 family transposase [Nitrospirota bacterium]
MKDKSSLKSLYHCVYKLTYHLVLMTKYRRNVITPDMLNDLKDVFTKVCKLWDCELIEFNGENDHVHLLLEAHPNLKLSDFVNNLKTVSSRLIRKMYKSHINKFYRKPVFWHRSYCIVSTGGAPLKVIKKYIEQQDIA